MTNVIICVLSKCFEELLNTAQSIVNFSGLYVMGVGNFISCHFEVTELLFEFQIIVMPRINVKVFLKVLVFNEIN